jgi:AcrR family transcriptional regulator
MDGRPIPRACVLKIPTQRRSVEMVHAILDAAVGVLTASGPEDFTTNTVAERAGVSIGSLYQYFANKDMLMGAIIERAILEIEAVVRARATTDTRSIEEALPDLANELIDICEPHREIIRTALYTAPLLGTGIAAVLETRLMDVARDYFARHSDVYRIEGGPAVLYVAINSATYVFLKWIAERPSSVPREDFVREAIRQLISGVRRPSIDSGQK